MKRFIVEGTWSGYTSSQSRVVHRTVTTRPEIYDGLSAIVFTDNTNLYITVYPCQPRENVREIHGYEQLLREAIASGKKGFVHVNDIGKAQRDRISATNESKLE